MALDSNSVSDQQRLIASLAAAPESFGPDCTHVRLLETHISHVLLTGRHAYKIKKRVDLGFLDFTTLDARRFYCDEELRLNRRTAPSLYLDVVAITGTIERPVLGGDGPVLDYAVRMLEFSQEALASRLLRHRRLGAADIDALAARVAAFHASVAVAAPDSGFGRPDDILRIALRNFETVRPLLEPGTAGQELAALAQWTEREYRRHQPVFAARQRDGFVRECHGDLHLGNIARIDGALIPFDCIEFNPEMRWIDVLSEVAFTVMDLDDHGRGDLGQRFLNGYLEITGDYAGLPVLRFYLAYRAMVRAMVARLHAGQLAAGDARRNALAEYDGYIDLARSYARAPHPAIVITHGLAGSGKTTLSQPLLELLRAVRIRTDVERKRQHGLTPRERRPEGIDRGLYAPDSTEATYRGVLALARGAIEAGHIVIVDAAFLKRWQRDLFRSLAAELRVPFVIVSFAAREAWLRERIVRRAAAARDASDATLAVLDYQLQTQDPLARDELPETVVYDSEAPLEQAERPASWEAVVGRLRDHAWNAAGAASPAGNHGIRAKVEFLSSPESYPETVARVDVVETHLSWVFLTERHAWKLKKPVRTQDVDFTTVTARHINCNEELRLNRRLSKDVYLDVVPVGRDEGGQLALGTSGDPLDWLVKMRRLPAARMLDRLIRDRLATRRDIRRVVTRLARFYRDSEPLAVAGAAYRDGFARGIDDNARELSRPRFDLSVQRVAALASRQSVLLERQPGLFDARASAGRIVEAHGDLRPEHICLEDDVEPQIIDCLEFSRALRMLDAADELAFLALECERLGAPAFAATIFDTYAEVAGDDPPPALLAFYRSYRAFVRAKLAIRHLDDPLPRDPAKWIAQARSYLELAWHHAARIG